MKTPGPFGFVALSFLAVAACAESTQPAGTPPVGTRLCSADRLLVSADGYQPAENANPFDYGYDIRLVRE